MHTLLFKLELVDQSTNTLEPNLHLLICLDGALGGASPSDAAGGAHEDDGTALEGGALGEERDGLRAGKDHVVGVGFLHGLAREDAAEGEVIGVDLAGADKDGANGARVVESLAKAPLVVGELELADGDVVGAGVAEDVLEGVGFRDVAGVGANDQRELGLKVELVLGDGCDGEGAGAGERGARLDEEDGLVGDAAVGLFCVGWGQRRRGADVPIKLRPRQRTMLQSFWEMGERSWSQGRTNRCSPLR
jgi:hypothetical protein